MGRFILGIIVGLTVAYFYSKSGGSPAVTTATAVLPVGPPSTPNIAAAYFSFSAKSAAVISFFLAIGVLVLFTIVSEGGFVQGELSVVIGSFFTFWLTFFIVIWWLFS
ncbi:hypothetical protein [Methylobacterium sp. Leaf85]|uniref:hypothetical protein n=1 Tax=Methylobacterium sp. Leaf85 TaxID=1736241 RepID=UPI0012E95004|nr:hypothetical protein [Methylobacterium sp. Leaf85]